MEGPVIYMSVTSQCSQPSFSGTKLPRDCMLVNYLYLVDELVILAKEMALFCARIPQSAFKSADSFARIAVSWRWVSGICCPWIVEVLRYRKATLCLGGRDVISSSDESHHVFPLLGR